jgi:hypothetical protein
MMAISGFTEKNRSIHINDKWRFKSQILIQMNFSHDSREVEYASPRSGSIRPMICMKSRRYSQEVACYHFDDIVLTST